MKKFLFSLALLSSMSAFSTVTLSPLAELSLKYDLRNVVETTFGMTVVYIEYSDDQEALNVYFDKRGCYRMNLEEVTSYGQKRLIVTDSIRDLRCDKDN